MQHKMLLGVAAVTLGLLVGAPVVAQGNQQPNRAEQQKKQKSQQGQKKGQRANADINKHMQGWPDASKKAARATVEKYGMPDGITDTMLVWQDTGPFKRTIVYKQAVDHRFPMPHKDVLEQTIDYDVPVEMADDLALYDGSVIIDRTRGELSARCDVEGANILALNLADDIVTNRKTVQQARDTYARSILEMKQGDPPAIASRLMFDLKQGDTTSPDRPHRFVAEAQNRRQ